MAVLSADVMQQEDRSTILVGIICFMADMCDVLPTATSW
jgi:hypothetical protein